MECTTKEEIEAACLDENKRRFTQANNTTFASDLITSQIDYLATNEISEFILKGDCVDLPLNDLQTKLLQGMRTPKSILDSGELSPWITQEEWYHCWKRQNEDTSSGPSGLHFGHFKCNAKNEELCDIDTILASIPFATGYSPQ